MADDKLVCWEVKVGFKEMDMSGGDNVDGPRWTGKFTDEEVTRNIVARTEALAKAGALTLFYEHQGAKAKSAKKVCTVHRVVRLEK
jgi:hypothetical protein